MVPVAARGSADQPGAAIVGDADAERQAEARNTKNTDADVNLSESAHNPTPSGEPPWVRPLSSTNKPKPKSAFFKIVERWRGDMVIAWSAALFGKSYGVWNWLTPLRVGSPRWW